MEERTKRARIKRVAEDAPALSKPRDERSNSPKNGNNEPVRLNKFIAQSGICSRRDADQLIKEGAIKLNGEVVTELGKKVLPTDRIEYNGQVLRGERKVYIVMNKPKGYVTSLDDPHNDKNVIDILGGKVKERVFPVGRLDKYTTGVLIITNDGELTKTLTHPSFKKKKIYHVKLDRPAEIDIPQKLTNGIELEDGPAYADEISFVDSSRKELGVEIHSGRNRIVRRMFDALGYEVKSLDRVYFAGLTKLGLKRGWWRYLTTAEVSMLRSGHYE